MNDEEDRIIEVRKMSHLEKISLIFLDIDGVLTLNEEDDERIIPMLEAKGHSSSDDIPCDEYDEMIVELFSEESVNWLEKLISHSIKEVNHSVGIVLSSDWRLNRDIPFLRKLFRKFNFSVYLFARTYSFQEEDVSRCEEIMHFLKYEISSARDSQESTLLVKGITPSNHEELFEVYSFVIIDDHDLSFSQYFPQQYISCHSSLFDEHQYQSALAQIIIPWYHCEKAQKSLKHFNPKKYSIAQENLTLK